MTALLPPIAPMTPLFECGTLLRGRSAPHQPSLMDLPKVVVTGQGRIAIAQLLKMARIGPGDGVLLPAYHCLAMTAAVRAAGALPVFCPIQEDLSVLPEDALLAARNRNVKAAIIPHLFAWRQAKGLFDHLRATTQWLLIEDCAHAFFGFSGDEPIGSWGHYAIGSIAKFFPLPWGGLIGSVDHELPIELKRRSLGFDAKLIANTLEQSARFRHLGLASIPVQSMLTLATRLRRTTHNSSAAESSVPIESVTSSEFAIDAETLEWDGGRSAAKLISSPGVRFQMASNRATIFEQFRRSLSGLKHARTVCDGRAPDFPPYVFPLLLSDPDRHFPELRRLGVPMYRWEDTYFENCTVAKLYGKSLVQLPCHSTLRTSEISAILAAVVGVLG